MKRDLNNPAYADEVHRRWQRRRYRVQQRGTAMAALREALVTSALYRWLVRVGRTLG